MGFLDKLLGRTTPVKPNLDQLFGVPGAALTLEAAAGFRPSGLGSVAYRAAEGGAFAALQKDVQELLDADEGPDVERTKDQYGYTWLLVRHDPSDISGLVTDLHAVNTTLEGQGFGPMLLCSIVGFTDAEGRSLALVYLYKRGAFYPFAPTSGSGATPPWSFRCAACSPTTCGSRRTWRGGSRCGAPPGYDPGACRLLAIVAAVTTTTDLRRAVERVLPGVREDLDALVRIPSVSADPARARDVLRSAEATADLLRAAGSGDVRVIVADGGAPAVVGPLAGAGRDADRAALRPPRRAADRSAAGLGQLPLRADGARRAALRARRRRRQGRGGRDLAALRAWDGRPPLGVTVLVEGEEEIGSPTLAALLAEHRDLLACDVMVLADSTNWAVGRPALTRSLRGLADCVVQVRTLEHAVHSGLYGGAVPDALTALCRLLATLHDEAGTWPSPGW